jgi:hypothetical protein
MLLRLIVLHLEPRSLDRQKMNRNFGGLGDQPMILIRLRKRVRVVSQGYAHQAKGLYRAIKIIQNNSAFVIVNYLLAKIAQSFHNMTFTSMNVVIVMEAK